MQVKPDRINLIIGSGGKKVKSIIEETGVESIDTQDDGIVSWENMCSCSYMVNPYLSNILFDMSFQVKITAKDLASLEKSKAIISNLTMVPTIGDIYRC